MWGDTSKQCDAFCVQTFLRLPSKLDVDPKRHRIETSESIFLYILHPSMILMIVIEQGFQVDRPRPLPEKSDSGLEFVPTHPIPPSTHTSDSINSTQHSVPTTHSIHYPQWSTHYSNHPPNSFKSTPPSTQHSTHPTVFKKIRFQTLAISDLPSWYQISIPRNIKFQTT